MSPAAVCLSDLSGEGEDEVSGEAGKVKVDTQADVEGGTGSTITDPDTAEKAKTDTEPMEKEMSRLAICPYAYARDCATPAWPEPAYPPKSEIADGVAEFWPVMDDSLRILAQERICRSLMANRSAPALVAIPSPAPPVSQAELLMADGFLAQVD